jgi:glutathione peroxidase
MVAKIYEFQVTTLAGDTVYLSDFEDQVLLIVNTASACGFTPQYAELEQLYGSYKDQGFAVLGFPCNQFGAQEPGDARQIAEFCRSNFDVTFPMFAKVDVKGPTAHPLFDYLSATKRGLLNTKSIKWNFTKFLVDRDGIVRARFAPKVAPKKIEPEIQRLL